MIGERLRVSSHDRPRLRWPGPPLAAALLLTAAVNVGVLAQLTVPFVGPALGFWFLICQPVYLVYSAALWREDSAITRLGYSFTVVLLGLMLAGLAENSVLPLLGVQRPLDPVPILVMADLLTIALYLLRRRYPVPQRPFRIRLRALSRWDNRLITSGAVFVALAVLGANRLNNGAGDQVSLAALAVAALTLGLLLLRHRQASDLGVAAALYLLALGLLLMTSLRGWYVTGHDIQLEYQVFQLAVAHGGWSVEAQHSAYNACLSITILPTELASVIHVAGPYIYKFFFQVIFAVCPVLVYAIARRFWSRLISVLATVYVISFPTFFTDMPYINRQEIAFLFVCAGVLALTSTTWGLRERQIAVLASGVGVEISHYSTMYVWLGVLTAAWAFQSAVHVRHWIKGRGGTHRTISSWASASRTVGIGSVLALAGIVFVWGFLITRQAGPIVTETVSAISSLLKGQAGARSSAVGYSLLFGKTTDPQTVLNSYSKAAFNTIRAKDQSAFVEPLSLASQYRVRAAAPPVMPLTSAGRFLSNLGVPIRGLNRAMRETAAFGEQVFVFIGLIVFMLKRRHQRQVKLEFFALSVGSVVLLALITVAPGLSVDYGVQRMFQEALIVMAPVLVAGSVTAFGWLGKTWAVRSAIAVCVAIFASTVGLIPQVMGGYTPQLSLNNSGLYYDAYYIHPQEADAVSWLASEDGVLPAGFQAPLTQNRFLFTAPSDVTGDQAILDAFPPLVRANSWLIMSYSIVHSRIAWTFYDGDEVPYIYPVSMIQGTKNLVYDNGSAELYR